MSKPTDYQRWWMRAILNGREVTQGGLMRATHGRHVFKIHYKSFDNAIKKGLIEFTNESTFLTQLGRKALTG